jgi:hypothetical protein
MDLAKAYTAKERYAERLLAAPGVVGVGVTLSGSGEPAVSIYVESEADGRSLPVELDGVPVVVTVTGRIHPVAGPAYPESEAER